MTYLALRRRGAQAGWVALEEIVRVVPAWTNKTPDVAGPVIARLGIETWFKPLVEYEAITKGPYRFHDPDPVFAPDRDAADEFISAKPAPMSRTSPRAGRARRRRINPAELAAYDLLAQYGVYLPEVVDLIIQRVGDPSRIENVDDRIGDRVRADRAPARPRRAPSDRVEALGIHRTGWRGVEAVGGGECVSDTMRQCRMHAHTSPPSFGFRFLTQAAVDTLEGRDVA